MKDGVTKEFNQSKKLSGEQIDPACCGVAVGWASPGCAAAAKGDGVHVLKGHLSWVKMKSYLL